MGICGCRKRTSLFCFVHKKAVCNSCILDHKDCLVKTYLEWLQNCESDVQTCSLCKGVITSDNSIRLTCLDLFHPTCLDAHAASFPSHTAQAGYTCPNCSKPIIPSDVSTPLAKQVIQHFEESAWYKKLGNVNFSEQTQNTEQEKASDPLDSPSITSLPGASTSSYIRKSQLKPSSVTQSAEDDDDDKYHKKSLFDIFMSSPAPEKKKPLETTKSRRTVNTKRMLALFILFSTVATLFVLRLSLSESTTE
eukprot:TRINITY_DN16819_c0_g1_i1.p1 TRINITY_DN16819_c0_g1~~TRINITY_DN16819_c0_g1_i1.p1  ORF type:complete len:250 (-),score=39.26 TRINITY_DN16819_c0_g1_i1:98-847(-)